MRLAEVLVNYQCRTLIAVSRDWLEVRLRRLIVFARDWLEVRLIIDRKG